MQVPILSKQPPIKKAVLPTRWWEFGQPNIWNICTRQTEIMKPQGSRGHEIPNDLKTQWLVLYWKPHQWLSDTNWWYSKTTIFIQFLYFHPFSSYQKKQRRKNLSRRFSGSCTFSKITKTYSRLVLLRVTDFSYCRLRLNPHPNQPKIREPPRNFFVDF